MNVEDDAHRMSAIDEVPGLYISDNTVPRCPEKLRETGITHVLTLTNERDCPHVSTGPETGIEEHLRVPIEDNPYEDLLICLDGLCAWIEHALTRSTPGTAPIAEIDDGDALLTPSPSAKVETKAKQKENKVLVHCAQGISRSGAVVTAYLMRALSLDYAAALSVVRTRRSVVMPNSGFTDQLRLWRQMSYRVYTDGKDGCELEVKAEYEDWRSNRGLLLARAEEEKRAAIATKAKNLAKTLDYSGKSYDAKRRV